MTISEESRHHLYERLDEVLGRQDATVLMEHLPPVGWADVATKRDLDALEMRLVARLDSRLDRQLRQQTWQLTVVMMAVLSIMTAVFTAVVKL